VASAGVVEVVEVEAVGSNHRRTLDFWKSLVLAVVADAAADAAAVAAAAADAAADDDDDDDDVVRR